MGKLDGRLWCFTCWQDQGLYLCFLRDKRQKCSSLVTHFTARGCVRICTCKQDRFQVLCLSFCRFLVFSSCDTMIFKNHGRFPPSQHGWDDRLWMHCFVAIHIWIYNVLTTQTAKRLTKLFQQRVVMLFGKEERSMPVCRFDLIEGHELGPSPQMCAFVVLTCFSSIITVVIKLFIPSFSQDKTRICVQDSSRLFLRWKGVAGKWRDQRRPYIPVLWSWGSSAILAHWVLYQGNVPWKIHSCCWCTKE